MLELLSAALVAAALFLITGILLFLTSLGEPNSLKRVGAVVALLTGTGASYFMFKAYNGEPAWAFERSAAVDGHQGNGRQGNGGAERQSGSGANGGQRGAGSSGGAASEGHGGAGDEGSAGFQLASLMRVPPRKPVPGDALKDCDDCPDLVVVGTGYFQMGAASDDHEANSAERPVQVVRVAHPFAIGRTEVTVGQYLAFVREAGARTPACSSPIHQREPALPVACVSWREAQAYVAWLGVKTNRPYRLPTEAEWEFAARGGAGTPYVFGADIEASQAYVGRDRFQRVKVGSFPANGYGLFDVHGSVAEMVGDCWADSHKGRARDSAIVNRRGDCGRRVLRDAGAYEAVDLSRLSARRPIGLDARVSSVGFRVMRELRD